MDTARPHAPWHAQDSPLTLADDRNWEPGTSISWSFSSVEFIEGMRCIIPVRNKLAG